MLTNYPPAGRSPAGGRGAEGWIRGETGANDFAGDIVVAQVGADVRLTIEDDADETQAVALLLTEQATNINASDCIFIA